MSGCAATIAGDEVPDGARNALIVASSDYADSGLRLLQAPASDARALEAVLSDPAIGGFEVRTLLNRPNQEVALAVEDFFADRQPDALLLAHFSCHGIKDEEGELYFAMADTLLRRLAATAVAASFVNQRMTRSRSKRVVLLLDCCYAGAFERGMTARVGGGVGIEAQLGGGRGRAVITASDAMQYAYEGGELAATGDPTPSVFTSALVSGLQTGEADRDQDGKVALDELYDYIYERVQEATPNQTPCKWTYDVRGDLFIARRSRPVSTPAQLPGKLQEALDNPFPEVRAAAVRELDRLLHGRHEGLALAARLTLQQLTDDDSRAVSAAATAVLATGVPAAESPRPEPSTTDDDSGAVSLVAATAFATDQPPAVSPRLEPSAASVEFGPLTQRSQSPERSIRLGNAGGGDLNAHAATQASWIRLRQVGDELYVAVDTGVVGKYEGIVTIDSDGGSTVIFVKASIVSAPERQQAQQAVKPEAAEQNGHSQGVANAAQPQAAESRPSAATTVDEPAEAALTELQEAVTNREQAPLKASTAADRRASLRSYLDVNLRPISGRRFWHLISFVLAPTIYGLVIVVPLIFVRNRAIRMNAILALEVCIFGGLWLAPTIIGANGHLWSPGQSVPLRIFLIVLGALGLAVSLAMLIFCIVQIGRHRQPVIPALTRAAHRLAYGKTEAPWPVRGTPSARFHHGG